MSKQKSKHTPGPWVPLFIRDEQKISICNPETKEFVCRIKNEVSGRPIGEDDKANARLIAAAPELLESLKEVVGLACPHPLENKVLFAVCEAAKSIIAKAEGN